MDPTPNVPKRTPVKLKTLVRNDAGPKDPLSEVLDEQELEADERPI